ncbi:MAG: thioredoxin domain-containing protein [Gordonia sp. (in: high G+C Gram-positive bacteria)]
MSKKPAAAPKSNPAYEPRASSSRSTYFLVGVGVLVVALIIIGLVWRATKTYPPVDDKVLAENASFIVGQRTAPVTIDVFEDAACPHCGEFEQQSGGAINAAVDAGQIRVRYHLLNFLDGESDSGDYSSRAAGAVLCVAEDGDAAVFRSFHAALFARARQGQANGDDNELAQLAAQAGANEKTQTCIRDGARVGAAKKMADSSATQLSNSNEGNVATPSVLVAGAMVDDVMNGDGWLAKVVKDGGVK